jgi:hypothetical protein
LLIFKIQKDNQQLTTFGEHVKVTIELDLGLPKHQKLMEAFLASQSATDTSVGEVAPAKTEPTPEPTPVEVPIPLKQQLAEAFNAATAKDANAAGQTASAAMEQHGANSDDWPEQTTKQVISQLQAIATL